MTYLEIGRFRLTGWPATLTLIAMYYAMIAAIGLFMWWLI